MIRYSAIALALLLACPLALGHGGGLDAEGCHTKSRTGEYHCHRDGASGDRAPGDSGGYDRADYHGYWQDADGDCQDTRQEVLIEESRSEVVLDAEGCRVVRGEWQDPYTGERFTDPSRLDIDHLVPLREVHDSGGDEWGERRRHRYANDLESPRTLIAVEAGANRSKGARGPAEWLPENEAYRCQYVSDWVRVKRRWELSMDRMERRAIREAREQYCE